MEGQAYKLKNTLNELVNQEKQLNTQYNQQMNELENKINLQNETAQENVRALIETQKQLDTLKSQSQKLEKQLQLAQTVSEFHDSCRYQEKIAELNRNINSTSIKCEQLKRAIDEQTERFEKMHGDSIRQLRG